MPKAKPRGAKDGGPPVFLSAVAAFKLATAERASVPQDKQAFNSRPRPLNAYPAPPGTSVRSP